MDPQLRNVEVKVKGEGEGEMKVVAKVVADTTIYVHPAQGRNGIPVKVTAWGDNAEDLMQYKKGESLHFIGQPSMDSYKHANMDKSIGKMGFTIKMIDHDKTLMKEVDQILRDHMKVKEAELGKQQQLQKGAQKPAPAMEPTLG